MSRGPQGSAYTRKMSTSLFSTDMEMLGQFRRESTRSLSSPTGFADVTQFND